MSSYIQNLRRERDVLAVTKAEFAVFASAVPLDHLILVFEGPDDKIAYAHWLRRIDPYVRYEALIKHNKAAVLKLFDALANDFTGLSKRARYFVDRDFDDLQGRDAASAIFMTDCYALENYCVNLDVLSDVLKEEFHCNGFNDARDKMLELFKDVYGEFLSETRDINLRIFLSRRLSISQDERLPNRLNQFVAVELEGVKRLAGDLGELIPLQREPSIEEVEALTPAFDELEPAYRYRGKFALMFFSRWLGLLRSERVGDASELFGAYGKSNYAVRGDFSFETLVPRAAPPTGLKEFLQTSAPRA
jgi:hypothetical protein